MAAWRQTSVVSDSTSATALRALLVRTLAEASGQAETRWEKLLGEVKHAVPRHNPTTNWRLTWTGSAEDRVAIRRAVEIVRAEHPYVDWR